MTTYYIDHIDGNDSNSGLDFANRKKSLKSALAAGGSGSDKEYRIIKTPGGLVTPNSTWRSRINRSPSSISNVTNLGGGAGYQITQNNHNYQTGDLVDFYAFSESRLNGMWVVTVIDSNTYTIPCQYTGYSGTSGNRYAWPAQNCLVSFDVSPVKNFLLNVTGATGNHVSPTWIGSGNTYLTIYTPSGLSHAVPTQAMTSYLRIYSGFATGKAFYYTFPSSLDLTGYRQISFFAKIQYAQQIANASIKWVLCSDNNGDIPVYEFSIPALGRTNDWIPLTIDCDNLAEGQTMTTPINSIALYVHTDRGEIRLYVQNFIACKGPKDDDCVSHNSVLSPKREGDIWYPVMYCDENVGAIITPRRWADGLNAGNNQKTRRYGYVAPSFSPATWNDRFSTVLTETGLNCYVMNPTNTQLAAAGRLSTGTTDTAGEYLNNRDDITITGGWNRTDMSTRDNPDDISSISWFSSGGTNVSGIYARSCDRLNLKNIGFRDGNYGLYSSTGNYNWVHENIHCAGPLTGMYITQTSYGHRFDGVKDVCNYRGLNIGGTSGNINVKNVTSVGGDGAVRTIDSSNCNITNVTSKNHAEAGIYVYRASRVNIKNLTAKNDRYTMFAAYNAYRVNLQNVVSDGNERFQYYYVSATQGTNCSFWRYSGITFSGISSLNNILVPSIAGGNTSGSHAVAPYTPRYGQFGSIGYHDPHNCNGFADGTYVAASGYSAIERRTPHQGNYSMGITANSGGYRYDFGLNRAVVEPVAVSNQSLGIYSRGLAPRVVIAEFSVIANQTVIFTAQMRRTAYDNDHVQGNLYVGPECGNPIVRGSLMTTYGQWEEKTISVTPSRAGVMKVCVEIYQYYTNSSSSPARCIDVDTITVTQG